MQYVSQSPWVVVICAWSLEVILKRVEAGKHTIKHLQRSEVPASTANLVRARPVNIYRSTCFYQSFTPRQVLALVTPTVQSSSLLLYCLLEHVPESHPTPRACLDDFHRSAMFSMILRDCRAPHHVLFRVN